MEVGNLRGKILNPITHTRAFRMTVKQVELKEQLYYTGRNSEKDEVLGTRTD
jgi:hypothetical protein